MSPFHQIEGKGGNFLHLTLRYERFKELSKMCPLQFIVLCGPVFLTSGGKCLRDGWVKERCPNWWSGPLELVRANDAGISHGSDSVQWERAPI